MCCGEGSEHKAHIYISEEELPERIVAEIRAAFAFLGFRPFVGRGIGLPLLAAALSALSAASRVSMTLSLGPFSLLAKMIIEDAATPQD